MSTNFSSNTAHDADDGQQRTQEWQYADPEPPREGSSRNEIDKYIDDLKKHFDATMSYYETRDSKWSPKRMWETAVEDFNPSALKYLDNERIKILRDVLRDQNINIPAGRGQVRRTSVMDCISSEHFPGILSDAGKRDRIDTNNSDTFQEQEVSSTPSVSKQELDSLPQESPSNHESLDLRNVKLEDNHLDSAVPLEKIQIFSSGLAGFSRAVSTRMKFSGL